MKKYIFILISCYCFSQNNKTITYELTRKINDLEFNAIGELNIDSKNQISSFNLSQYKNLIKKDAKLIDSKTRDTTKIISTGNICYEDKIYYFDLKKDSLLSILYDVNCKSKVLVKDKIILPKWKIFNEFKEISGYKTQKATAFINDRTWTVYFTNQLNINAGPWRLTGLPGVVFEAFENSTIYSFKLIKIDKLKNEIVKPYYQKKSTFVEFVNKAVMQHTAEISFLMSQIDGEAIDKDELPIYETLEFIEKRETKK